MKMDAMWDESLGHRLKVERNLNFSTISNEEDEFGFSRKKTARDPMSHRIIEKRRRDRMNNCLADLSRLVPTNYLKKGRGRIEKTEIIEMAIKHLKHLQAHQCSDPATCEVAKTTEQDHKRQYRLGFHECLSEAVRFLVEMEGLYSGDGICVRLVNHLQKHYEKVAGGLCYSQSLGIIPPDEKSQHMDVIVENSNHALHSPRCNIIEPYQEVPIVAEPDTNKHPPMDTVPPPPPPIEVLKHEQDTHSNGYHEHPDYNSPAPVAKVSSQLREMLQNPGPPKENHHKQQPSPQQSLYLGNHQNGVSAISVSQGSPVHPSRGEEVYKFKNNIKHRFNNDLRHLTSSPTDSHSDHVSLPDESNGHHHHESEDRLQGPLCHSGHFNGHHRPFIEGELSVKIPQGGNNAHHWETGSSCGSNPSTPPVARSNGSTSSSGYSTDSKFKGPHHPGHSPAVSPYSSRTPDRGSPSPTAETVSIGVPIFALHPKGAFYIPLTLDSGFLAPYLLGLEEVAPVLHPVSICVNFSLCQALKVEKLNGKSFQFRSQPSYFTEKLAGERYVYGERQNY